MDAFGYIVMAISVVVIIISIYNILDPNSEYNKRKREEKGGGSNISHSDPVKIGDTPEEIQRKIEEAKQRASELYMNHLKQVETLRKQREEEEAKIIAILPKNIYKGRRPSLDSIGMAIEGYGVVFKVVGMKYRPFESQIAARCLEAGDVVLLKPEINSFNGAKAMAVYTTTKQHIGYIVTEQCQEAIDLMYDEKFPAYVKETWDGEKSWFVVVVPGVD